jgi:hypothetical protein
MGSKRELKPAQFYISSLEAKAEDFQKAIRS